MNNYIEPKLGEPFPGEAEAKELFTGPIFFGQHDCTDDVDLAHCQLDEAFLHVSGLQQPCHPESEEAARECEAQDKADWDRVRALARSLVIAMGVEDILKPETPPDPADLTFQLSQAQEKIQELETSNLRVRYLTQDILDVLGPHPKIVCISDDPGPRRA
jgi:hypothetical protein